MRFLSHHWTCGIMVNNVAMWPWCDGCPDGAVITGVSNTRHLFALVSLGNSKVDECWAQQLMKSSESSSTHDINTPFDASIYLSLFPTHGVGIYAFIYTRRSRGWMCAFFRELASPDLFLQCRSIFYRWGLYLNGCDCQVNTFPPIALKTEVESTRRALTPNR